MGLVHYRPMLALQHERHAAVLAGHMPDSLFLLEHPPVITLGRTRGAQHVLASAATLRARGIETVVTTRGGDVTYHGPGQIVAYPILALAPHEQDVRAYVYRLEEIVLRTVADFGVHASRVAGLRGIWVGNDKLAAIGVRIARWTTLHGFALNVAPNLQDFALIVPCGLRGRGVTSLAKLLGQAPDAEAVQQRLLQHSSVVLQRQLTLAAASSPRRLGAAAEHS